MEEKKDLTDALTQALLGLAETEKRIRDLHEQIYPTRKQRRNEILRLIIIFNIVFGILFWTIVILWLKAI